MYFFHFHNPHYLLISDKKTGIPRIYCIGMPAFNILLDIDRLIYRQLFINKERISRAALAGAPGSPKRLLTSL